MKKLAILLVLLLTIFAPLSYCEHPLIVEAEQHLDAPYSYASFGPKSFDCSGFTYYCFKQVYGIELNHSAYTQGYEGDYEFIKEIENLQIGDLVCFNTNSRDKDLSDHVGIYLGEGMFIHCSSAKGKVIESSLLEGYYNERFSWGRRVLDETYEKFYQRNVLEACTS